ncbi:MAG: RnfABCDGE type electron transport complex subunit B [Bacteroidales bacterium]|nr:RnfABCDGE type electron transport complex subunit B [Candidatus Colimorpha onthohippi]
MDVFWISLLVLGLIGAVFALLLYYVAQRFWVPEDPLIDEVLSVLPGANCGGCGKAGCKAMAEAFVKQGNMEGLRCPVGGESVARKVAALLDCSPLVTEPQVATVRCSACFAKQPTTLYDGLKDCAFVSSVYVGDGGCAYGCLGYGNCVPTCQFGAIKMDQERRIPVIDDDKCTGCGACANACPRHVIELRNRGVNNQKVFVRCVNQDKGVEARKVCTKACIGCGKCERTCLFGAVTVQNNVAYVDVRKCKQCRKCVVECPTGALVAQNFATPLKSQDSD